MALSRVYLTTAHCPFYHIHENFLNPPGLGVIIARLLGVGAALILDGPCPYL